MANRVGYYLQAIKKRLNQIFFTIKCNLKRVSLSRAKASLTKKDLYKKHWLKI